MDVFTIKLPTSLMNNLEESSKHSGCSKGELVRQALSQFLQAAENPHEKIKAVANQLKSPKKNKRSDWSDILLKTRVPMAITPEEEIMIGRRRNL